ncbi:MAG TPA: bifunctional precorrin-2 dehydrogenase/sirohydrochlorin ferrochelatase [Candidatus Xenobia bacterium]|jgi:siroheme synthase-like protein
MLASSNTYYPVMLDIRGRTALVVGAGKLARDKAAALSKAGALVQIWAGKPDIGTVQEAYIVVAATEEQELIDWLKMIVRPHQLFNVVDRPEDSKFICPSVVRRASLTVSVATDGTCPAMARLVRQRLEDFLGPEWDEFMALAVDARQKLRQAGVAPARRAAFFDSMVASEVLSHLQAGRQVEAENAVEELLHAV